MIAAYAKAKGINFAEINKPEYQEKIRRKYGFHDWNSCLATVGHGGLKESQIVNRMYDEYKKDHVVPVTDADVLGSIAESSRRRQAHSPSTSQRAVLWYTDSMTWLCTSRSAAILFREMKSWVLSQEAEASQSTGQTA